MQREGRWDARMAGRCNRVCHQVRVTAVCNDGTLVVLRGLDAQERRQKDRGASFAPKPPEKQPLPDHLDPPSQHSDDVVEASQRLKTLGAPVLSLTHLVQEGAEHRVVDAVDVCAAGVQRLR